ncbi:relaxase/mobilization nuclease domain-containing protein, partial [Variovorax sp. CAN15]|uniref:relaxase/mobilization nuclease domain-containing protein n=1 Tax=Variovorax sp. CAN15 TaxID=3046727 RepID=UPI0026485301
MRSSRRSNFAELVRYITDSQGNSERVGLVSITNCHSTDPISAGIEVQANQQLNRRSKADKTYHLIVSFRAGENPSDDVLAAIEKRICAAIGFEEHQRVSAAHYDTENVHLHIAISKVHPIKRTVHTPFNDHWHLARACEQLEAE